MTVGEHIDKLVAELRQDIHSPALRLFIVESVLIKLIGGGPSSIVKVDDKLVHQFPKYKEEQAVFDAYLQTLVKSYQQDGKALVAKK